MPKKNLEPGLVSVSKTVFKYGPMSGAAGALLVNSNRMIQLKQDLPVKLIRPAQQEDMIKRWGALADGYSYDAGRWWIAEHDGIAVWVSKNQVTTTLRK